MAGVLFEDIFNVKDIDPEGKKFDRGIDISTYLSRRTSRPRGPDNRTAFLLYVFAARSWTTREWNLQSVVEKATMTEFSAGIYWIFAACIAPINFAAQILSMC
ncbi:uncharacterized protein LOC105835354 [Monomorium pharaonis]|uniref:uncharacterized protein LOC105835354 n=1 Tax=Monomorium pharaonis TaxID=307658 RepID=UPI00063FB817|nr:uncharacterized protein LOC105835354 [Monomorium pharaonis]